MALPVSPGLKHIPKRTKEYMNSEAGNILDLEFEELRQRLEGAGEPGFRAKQVWQWLYQGATGFDEMTNLPKAFRKQDLFYIGNKQTIKLIYERTAREILFAVRTQGLAKRSYEKYPTHR